MIKYKIQTGCKATNMQARLHRDHFYKPYLKGLNCRKCSVETVIEFVPNGGIHSRPLIHSCCAMFRDRIKEKLLLAIELRSQRET